MAEKSKVFALEAIQVCKELRAAKYESALINQFLHSGTSIGANIVMPNMHNAIVKKQVVISL